MVVLISLPSPAA